MTMKFSANKMELIEKYYNETLTEEELVFFNEQLAKDSKFSEEVKQLKFIFKGLDRARSNQLKEEFEEIERSIKKSIPKPRSFQALLNKYSVTALVSLILVAGFCVTTILNSSIEHQLLYVDHFRPYPNVIAPTTRSANPQNSAIYSAMSQYDSMHFSAAVLAFDVLLKETTAMENEIQFYKAVALMSDGLHEEAKSLFMQMDESGSFKNQRKWYLALTLLQLNELDEAEVLLKEIKQSCTSYSLNARDLLEKFFSKED
jgi:hypothetical protein